MQLTHCMPLQFYATRPEHQTTVAKDAGVMPHLTHRAARVVIKFDLGLRWVVTSDWKRKSAQAFKGKHGRYICGQLAHLLRTGRRVDGLVQVTGRDENISKGAVLILASSAE